MIKGALLVCAALFSLATSVFAQDSGSPGNPALGSFSAPSLSDASVVLSVPAGSALALNNGWHEPSPMTLADGQAFSFPGAFGWVEAEPAGFLPAFEVVPLPFFGPVGPYQASSFGQLPELKPGQVSVHGEVGVLFGAFTGKHGGDFESGFLSSQIIDGNTAINVGISYDRFHGPSRIYYGR